MLKQLRLEINRSMRLQKLNNTLYIKGIPTSLFSINF